MTETKSATRATQKPATRTTANNKKRAGFTDAERAAMRARAKEVKAESGRGPRASKPDGESAVLAAIAAMSGADRTIGQRLHAVIRAAAPDLAPKTWYGMPAYAKDGKVVCFFRSAEKFKERYVTLGFNDTANLDDGNLWPISYAVTKLTDTEETKIARLVRKAVNR